MIFKVPYGRPDGHFASVEQPGTVALPAAFPGGVPAGARDVRRIDAARAGPSGRPTATAPTPSTVAAGAGPASSRPSGT
ncbi:hypothetical protein GCM10025331_39030 [Actinoplanes utahensis]|nr:hypothetical protein Aut01nite_44650 [Actinoplanes utahensis]